MAQRLRADKQEVAFVALLDTYNFARMATAKIVRLPLAEDGISLRQPDTPAVEELARAISLTSSAWREMGSFPPCGKH